MNLRLLSSLSLAVVMTGCPEKKAEAPPAPKPAAVAEKPPEAAKPPPAAAEPRAERECAAPIDPTPVVELKLGTRTAKQTGARLTFSDADADGKLVFGVLGPVNEDSGINMVSLKKYAKFFADEKADAILVTGDVGELSTGIKRVLVELASTKLPVFVLAGNSECRAEYTDGVTAAKREASNIVNLNEVRVVEFPELTLFSLPGHHDPTFIKCATGCRYYQSTIDEIARAAKEAKGPTMLVAHGPPHGQGAQAIDYSSGNINAGDEAIAKLLTGANLSFGVFSNIKEAGARASSDVGGTTLVKEGQASKSLYLNPGPADSTTPWDMNDGSKGNGLAAVVSLADGAMSYKLLRLKPPTGAEKGEAKRLEPPAAAAAPAP